jgi:hypothetical protein
MAPKLESEKCKLQFIYVYLPTHMNGQLSQYSEWPDCGVDNRVSIPGRGRGFSLPQDEQLQNTFFVTLNSELELNLNDCRHKYIAADIYIYTASNPIDPKPHAEKQYSLHFI